MMKNMVFLEIQYKHGCYLKIKKKYINAFQSYVVKAQKEKKGRVGQNENTE